MGTMVQDDKYTVYPKSVMESNAEVEAMFEEQRKAREAQPPVEAPTEEPIEALPVEAPIEEPTGMVSKAELEKSEQRYRTLEGKYNTELGEFRRQNAFLYTIVQNLQTEVETLKKPKEEKKVKVSLRESPRFQALKEELAPEVFENLVGAWEETTEGLRQSFEEETSKIKSEISTTRVTDRNQIFWAAVNATHKDYDQMAKDPKLQEFLAEPEGHTGLTRGDFFMNAYERRDSETYIGYLNAFTEENPISANPDRKLGGGGIDQEKVKGRIAAPRGGGGSGIPPLASSQMTREQALAEYNRASAEYDKISDEFNKGLWNGREKDYDKKEAELRGIIQKTSKILDTG